MLHGENIESKSGFRALNAAELDAVSGGEVLHIDGDAALFPTLDLGVAGFDLANVTDIADGGNVLNLQIQTDGMDGSEYRISSSGSGSGSGADPDPSPVDPTNPLSGSPSSPPSLNQSGGISPTPQTNVGGGVSVGGAYTGSPTNPTGGGVSGSVTF